MGIINSITFRDKMYKRIRLTNSDSPMYETQEKNLKNFNCILQRNINTAKFFYYESKFNKYVSNIKQTWTTINELLNKCNNKKDFPSYFIINGDKIDNKEDYPYPVLKHGGPQIRMKINKEIEPRHE